MASKTILVDDETLFLGVVSEPSIHLADESTTHGTLDPHAPARGFFIYD